MSVIEIPAPPGTWRGFIETILGEEDAQGWPLNSSSLALEASRVVKSGAGRLFGLSILNTKGSAQFVQIFDQATLPADGAIPVFVVTVPTVANLGVFWGDWGRFFNRGIVVCNSSTSATKTIGSADCFFDAQYL